jgi:hypothetical protein
MPTITATVFPDEAYVRVDADWSDRPDVTYARVVRVNTVTGEETLLRPYVAYNAAGDLLLTCSKGVWWDTEPPLNTAIKYRTEPADSYTNRAINSSWENGVGSPAPWQVTGGTYTPSATFAHSGTVSGRLTPNGSPTFSNTLRQDSIPVDPAYDVFMSAWVLTPQGWNSSRLTLKFFTATGMQTGATLATPLEILDDAEWRYLSLSATPPTDTATATITFEVVGIAPNTTLFYVDQFELGQYVPSGFYAYSAVVTVTPTFPFYLKDPVYPCNDRAMTRCMPSPLVACNPVSGMMVQSYGPGEQYAAKTVLLEGVNREFPVPQVRPRASAQSNLVIITRLFADRDLLVATLKPGTVLFFQAPPEYGIADRYIAVGDYAPERALSDHRIPPRIFSLPHRVMARPAGAANGVCGARIDDLCDTWGSWAALKTAGLTWTDLLYGLASPNGPGQAAIAGLRTFDEVKAEFANFNAVNNGVRTFTGLRNGA